MRRSSYPPYFWAILLAAVLFAAGIPTALLLHRGSGSGPSAGNLANVRANADLLALKSEAEALAIEGKLSEAHAKYRQLQSLAATREIKDPLLWDILERAKASASGAAGAATANGNPIAITTIDAVISEMPRIANTSLVVTADYSTIARDANMRNPKCPFRHRERTKTSRAFLSTPSDGFAAGPKGRSFTPLIRIEPPQ